MLGGSPAEFLEKWASSWAEFILKLVGCLLDSREMGCVALGCDQKQHTAPFGAGDKGLAPRDPSSVPRANLE